MVCRNILRRTCESRNEAWHLWVEARAYEAHIGFTSILQPLDFITYDMNPIQLSSTSRAAHSSIGMIDVEGQALQQPSSHSVSGYRKKVSDVKAESHSRREG